MKIKKGDTVLIISGKDRGRKGKVLKTLSKEERLIVEGINLRKKHVRPKKAGEKGQIVELPAPLHVSNVKLICTKCGKATKVGYKSKTELPFMEAKGKKRTKFSSPIKNFTPTPKLGVGASKSKIRICKKCGQEI